MSLSCEEFSRYGRQMIIEQFGKTGQLKLKSKSVLIIGCGGLGCPCAQYLAAAGIGKLGLLDSDLVENCNLHRQILHTESRIDKAKPTSAEESLKQLNSNVIYTKLEMKLTRENAIEIIEQFDIIVDGTDNVISRYLISDACVITKKPLVSGAALRFEGQLTVYNYSETTPCYRCLYPYPPPTATVTNCRDGGVIGVVPGIIGCLQALEVIKIALDMTPSYAGKMLLFDGFNGSFRTVKIRNKRQNCIACGNNPSIGSDLIDYEEFVGKPCNSVKILKENERITCEEYKQILNSKKKHLLIDVRNKTQADIVILENAINLPLQEIEAENGIKKVKELIDGYDEIFVMCRAGNSSQKAVHFIKKHIPDLNIKDIIGGLTSWSNEIDSSVPIY